MMIIYNTVFYLIQPIIWIYLWLRGHKMPAYRKRWAERYGFCAGKVSSGGILLHSVSVGETLAAVPLVQALQHQYPTISITITTMTPTGSDCVKSIFGKAIHHVYLPYDLPDAMHRFLNTVKPKLVIILETELWPNFIKALHARQIPLVIASARLSIRSVKYYKKLGKFMHHLLQNITLIAAQNEDDGARFIELGLQSCRLAITGNLKFDISVTSDLKSRAIALRRQLAPHRPVWIATSTHEGEENIILEAHRFLLLNFPKLLLILVPRHPERFKTVINMTKKNGYSYILRSSGKIPSSTTQVIIGDTMGELMLLYGIADLSFVGGSLVASGGHNPLEPAAYAIPILMGPYTFNFEDICSKLKQADGLITITDSASLVHKISNLLVKDEYRQYHGKNAMKVLHQNQGALQRLLKLLELYLLPPGILKKNKY